MRMVLPEMLMEGTSTENVNEFSAGQRSSTSGNKKQGEECGRNGEVGRVVQAPEKVRLKSEGKCSEAAWRSRIRSDPLRGL